MVVSKGSQEEYRKPCLGYTFFRHTPICSGSPSWNIWVFSTWRTPFRLALFPLYGPVVSYRKAGGGSFNNSLDHASFPLSFSLSLFLSLLLLFFFFFFLKKKIFLFFSSVSSSFSFRFSSCFCFSFLSLRLTRILRAT